MISAPDVYHAGKTASDEVLNGLRMTFKEGSWGFTSTRIFYNKGDLNAKIIHNYGSTVITPKELGRVTVPIYQRKSVVELVEEDGLSYVQALFDTSDNPIEILNTLEKLCQKEPNNIIFFTPDHDSRNTKPVGTIRFNYDVQYFCVVGFGDLRNKGPTHTLNQKGN